MHLHKIRDILKVQIWIFSKRNIVWLLSKPLHFWWVLKSISKSATCFLLWKKQNASFPGPKIPRTKIYSGLSSLLILYLLCKTLYVSFFSIRQFKTIVCLLIRYPCFILNVLQANLCQKLLFLHQLTHNMTTDCSMNYKFNTWKFQAQTWAEHVVYRNCFWHSEDF